MRALMLWVFVGACGGTLDASTGAQDAGDGASSVDHVNAGWTECSAPSGDRICGGPYQCSQHGECKYCTQLPPPYDKFADLCTDKGQNIAGGTCELCPDGMLCLLTPIDVPVTETRSLVASSCMAEDYAPLFVKAGDMDRILYADRSRYTGEPLPTPATCPNIPGLPLCGGPCPSTCPKGKKCSGRSPLHPYSLCIETQDNGLPYGCRRSEPYRCLSNKGECLIFKVPGPYQVVADENGVCVDPSVCQAAAQSYPGGAFCLP